jgi:hypothetical protein
MATMPALSSSGQSASEPPSPADWFAGAAGRAVLDSELELIGAALSERPALPWLWLEPAADDLGSAISGGIEARRGLRLHQDGEGWGGPVRCGLPWPLASESIGTIILQHVVPPGPASQPLLEECARILSPHGALWLFGLNPLAPFRLRWRQAGLKGSEPTRWRRRLHAVGLSPATVSQGMGPRWAIAVDAHVQDGAGLRAAYALRADKRTIPLIPTRSRVPSLAPAAAT